MSRSHISLAEFHRRQRRGRRIFWALCVALLIVLALCLSACSPSLIRMDAPRPYAPGAKNSGAKEPATISPDEYWSGWLNQRTATRLTP